MTEKIEQSQDLPVLTSTPQASDGGTYNSVFERISARTENGEDRIHIVVACVAYYLYKSEKRDWLLQEKQKRSVSSTDIDNYVGSWTDMRIDSVVARADSIIQNFASDIVDFSKSEIDDQVYRAQFERLHSSIEKRDRDGVSRHEDLKNYIDSKTKPVWGAAIGQGLIFSLIWTAIVIIVVLGANVGFDFSDLPTRVKAFQHPDKAADAVPATAPSIDATPAH